MHILVLLKFTPLEFETLRYTLAPRRRVRLKFTPLEFETDIIFDKGLKISLLKFTPLEFETMINSASSSIICVKIYSVGV